MLSNAFTNLNLTDMETCYKMFRAPVIKGLQLKENRFGFEPEVTAKMSRVKACGSMKWASLIMAARTPKEKDRLEGWLPGDLVYYQVQPVFALSSGRILFTNRRYVVLCVFLTGKV